MLKKFISLILAGVMIVSIAVVSSVSARELTKADITEQAGFLQTLGIISEISEEASVSRAEFAVMAAAVMKRDMLSIQERYFVDVPEDHWAADSINTLVARGVISQPEDKIFRMYDKITANEAIKMVLSMCGYDYYAEQTGGYPIGYTKLARRLDINLEASEDAITPYEAYDLLYQALKLPLYDVEGIRGENIIASQSDETLLSVYFDIYMTEGFVSQARGVSVYKNKAGELKDIADYVVVDDVTYTSEINLYDYIGRNVKIFYQRTDKDATPHIIYRETTGEEGDVVEITSDEFAGYSNYEIIYVDKKNNKTKKESLNKGVIVIKNGTLCNNNLEDDIKLNKGFIRVVDKDNANGADYVFISDYTNIVAGVINSDSFTIYDKVTGNGRIELNPEEKAVFIENASGAELGFEDIASGNVLTVYDSAEYARVIVNSTSVTANIYGLKTTDGIQFIEVGKSDSDRKWLGIDKDYYNAVFKNNGHGAVKIAAGAEISYYTDAYGNIAYITEPMKDNWTYAYLVDVAEGSGVFSSQAKVKLYMQSGEMLIAAVSEKVRVDEVKAEGYDSLCEKLNKVSMQGKILQDGEDEVRGQLIRVKLNGDGEVSAIDTEYVNPNEDKYSLKRTVGYGEQKYWWHADAFPDANLYYNSTTVRFGVPAYSQQQSVDDKYYIVRTSKYDNLNTSSFTIEGFKTNLVSPVASVIVDYVDFGASATTPSKNAFMVDTITTKLDNNGDIVYAASVYSVTSGDLIEYIAEDEGVFAGLEKGDLIRFDEDALGKVIGCTVLYDYGNSQQQVQWGHITSDGAWGERERTYDLVHTYVKTNSNDIMRLWYSSTLTANDMQYENINNADRFLGYKPGGPLIVFDGRNITVTTLGEGILSAEITGVDNLRDYWFTINLAKAVSGVMYKK